ncbi:MAG TPA: hypothetical protein VIK57_16465 [Streptosporangiaceae bacterium]
MPGEEAQPQDRQPGSGPDQQPGQPHRDREQRDDRGREDTGNGERVLERGEVPAPRRGRRERLASALTRDWNSSPAAASTAVAASIPAGRTRAGGPRRPGWPHTTRRTAPLPAPSPWYAAGGG